MGLKIWMVDDDDVDVITARRALERIGADHAFEVHRDGGAAIAALRHALERERERLPDLLILDLNLPLVSGFEILRELRALPGWPGVPTVVLTTSAESVDIERAFDLGASGYFVKPMDFDEYAATMRALCGYASPTLPSDEPAGRTRILVVEDDSVDLLALQRLAEQQGLPWELVPAYSLREALACLARETVDLVLIDQILPDGHGAQLLERLGGLPAVFVAGDRGAAFREEVLRRGARGFVAKTASRSYLSEIPRAVAAALAADPPGA